METNLKKVKGFTLIELLVVIGIVAIVSAVTLLTLNPAELLKQSRDSNRISDLATLKSAISFYLADVITPDIASSSPYRYGGCYMSADIATSTRCGGFFQLTYFTNVTGTKRDVDGTGWLPVNFNLISARSPISNLPVDPVNTSPYYYAYAASTTPTLVYKIVANMESIKFAQNGKSDVESRDGGPFDWYLEVGSDPGLDL
ncbi:MAG: type II secretion system protein [Candidatus Liptonbacteria bacterium]|nr:type II secretion system protein [Candidatus Liptonbacteria bacterium]